MENPCEKAGMTIYILAILSVFDARIWYRGSLKISKLKQLFRELNVAPKCCLWTTETRILSASFVMMQQILKRRIEETAWKWSRLFPMHNEVRVIPSPLGVDIWLLSRLERSGWLWKKYPASIIVPKKKHTLDHRGKKINHRSLSRGKHVTRKKMFMHTPEKKKILVHEIFYNINCANIQNYSHLASKVKWPWR